MSPRAARRRRGHRAPTPLRVKAALAGAGTLVLTAACVAGAELFRSPAGDPDASALSGQAAAPPPEDPPAPAPTPSDTAPTTTSPTPSAKPPKATKAPKASKTPTPPRTAKKPTPTPSKTPAKKEAPAAKSAGGTQPVAGSKAQEVLRLVNAERAAVGCPALKTDPALTKAAQGHSDSMAASRNLSHTGTNGSQPQDRIEAAGYAWSRYGENIAVGQPTAAAVMDSWMNSSGHRANILNCAFTEIGIGINTSGGPWWTQNFGTPR